MVGMNSDFNYNNMEAGRSGRLSELSKLKISQANKGHVVTDETKKKMSLIRLGKHLEWKPVQDRIWINNNLEEKIINPNEFNFYKDLGFKKGRIEGICKGINNPMYGKEPWNKGKKSNITRWVHNDIETKRISEDELNNYLQNGYSIGRKINKRRTKLEMLLENINKS